MMAIPYTSTHALPYASFRDETEHYTGFAMNEVVHPVRRVREKIGADPKDWTYYDKVLDLDFIVKWVVWTGKDPMTREDIVWDMYDAVQWEGAVDGVEARPAYWVDTERILNGLKNGQALHSLSCSLPPPQRFIRRAPRVQLGNANLPNPQAVNLEDRFAALQVGSDQNDHGGWTDAERRELGVLMRAAQVMASGGLD